MLLIYMYYFPKCIIQKSIVRINLRTAYMHKWLANYELLEEIATRESPDAYSACT